MSLKIAIQFIILFLSFGLYCYADAVIPIGSLLKDSKEFEGQTISVRGFLYQISDGSWILASEPNLRTCCIEKKQRLSRQIYLPNFQGVQCDKPLTVIGKFTLNPEGTPSIFSLVEGEIGPEETQSKQFIPLLIAALIVTVGSGLFFKYMTSQRIPKALS